VPLVNYERLQKNYEKLRHQNKELQKSNEENVKRILGITTLLQELILDIHIPYMRHADVKEGRLST